jgi:diguanylate cyclase (GGDEF)-like protein
MLDIFGRQQRLSTITNPICFVALVSSVPWFGWAAMVPIILCVGIAQAIHVVVPPRVTRPEYPMTAAIMFVLVGTCLAFVVSHPPPLFALSFLSVLLFVTGAALPARGAAGSGVFGGIVMAATALLMDAHQVLGNPSIVVLPLALFGVVTLFGYGIGQATVDQLGAATIDQLTGMLNRTALRARVAELSHRLASGGHPTAVLIADLDCFKAVNDEHGHAMGDRVLAEVAERMRADLRLFDSVYRIGGEEFLVLLVGMDERTATAVGERIRASVCDRHVAGLPVTVSVGVSACTASEAFDYERLFADADAALLTAKANGRDRVVAATTAAASSASTLAAA